MTTASRTLKGKLSVHCRWVRRQPRKPLSSQPAPNDGSPLGHLNDAELLKTFAAEMARRRAARGDSTADESDAIEKLEKKFWSLLRILARKGLITREEFLQELENEE